MTIKTVYTASKKVGSGFWLALGSYDSHSKAVRAVDADRSFHLDRYPNDSVEYQVVHVQGPRKDYS